MSSPLTVKRNDYHARPKRSDVYTPLGVASFLFDVLRSAERCDLDRYVRDNSLNFEARHISSPSWTRQLGPDG